MKTPTTLLIIGFLLIAATATFLDQNRFQTADEKRWNSRVAAFILDLSHFSTDQIYQTQTPGITLQYLAAPSAFADSWSGLKVSLITHSLVLLLITTYLAYRLWGRDTAIIVLAFLAINPFFIAYNRVLGTDALLSQYIIVWFLSLALWQKTNMQRYLAFAGIAASLAWLTKLPGLITIPATLFYLGYTTYKDQPKVAPAYRSFLVFCSAFVGSAILVLPPLLWSAPSIISDMLNVFSKEGYTDEHAASASFYLRTLVFFTTPIHLMLFVLIPRLWRYFTPRRRQHLLWMLLFALAFTVMMAIGTKKGDRYLLPAIATLDVIAAVTVATLWRLLKHRQLSRPWLRPTAVLILLLFTWQLVQLPRLHPYYLAYVNPAAKPFFGDRRLGWGEGLDLAAAYLNQKPDAEQLKVATFYPKEFQNYFSGEAVDLHQWDSSSIDYAVLYRAQLQRSPEAWETDVWQQFQDKQPEHVIHLNGIDYVWIYQLATQN